MSDKSSKLIEVINRKDCNLPAFVKLLTQQLPNQEANVKKLLFDLGLHKLEPKEDDSIGHKIQLSDEEIIKSYLLNHRTFESPSHFRMPSTIKWGKAELINWLRTKKLEIPMIWEKWIEKDYPILLEHNATTLLNVDKPSSPFVAGDTPEERKNKIRQRLKEIEKEFPELKTMEKQIEKLMELHPSKYKISSIMKFAQKPRKDMKR